MKIYDDVIETLNKSKIHVRVLSTHNAMRGSCPEEDIPFLLSKRQAMYNQGYEPTDMDRFANMNHGRGSFVGENEARLRDLRESGRLLGADEYYEDAWLPIRELAFCVKRGEPIRYVEREDIPQIKRVVDTFLKECASDMADLRARGEELPDAIKGVIDYQEHITDLYDRYFGHRHDHQSKQEQCVLNDVEMATLGGFRVPD